MPKTRGGLGRGIGALIPGAQAQPQSENGVEHEEAETEQQQQSGVLEVSVETISPNPHQPRTEFKAEALHELADSIREHGVLQPLIVTRAEGGADGYYLIAGERRLRAAQLAGLERVPVIIKEANPNTMLAIALVENIQRADLHPLEEARAYRELIDDFGLTQEEVAKRVGRSRSKVANTVRLLNLPEEIIQALREEKITEGHGRAILQLEHRDAQLAMLQEVIEMGYSVRQTEELVRRTQDGTPTEAPPEEQTSSATPLRPKPRRAIPDVETNALEQHFREALRTNVELTRSSKGGKLTIHFYNEEMLEQIYQLIVQHEAGERG